MPKIIDPELKARAVRIVSEHPSLTAAGAAVAKQLALGEGDPAALGRPGPGGHRGTRGHHH